VPGKSGQKTRLCVVCNEDLSSFMNTESYFCIRNTFERPMRLMSRMICSDDDVRPSGFCFLSTRQVRMNKISPLNQRYICPTGADGVHWLSYHSLITTHPDSVIERILSKYSSKQIIHMYQNPGFQTFIESCLVTERLTVPSRD
jgi:hypothetical protein